MRLALWSTSYFKGFGGAEKVVNDLLIHFSQLGIESFLITNRLNKKQKNSKFFEPLNPKVKIYQNTFPNPLLFTNRPLVFIFKIFQYLKASIQFGFFLHKNRIEVIHLHLVNIDVLLLVLYKYLFKYRLVITFTGMESEIARLSNISRIKIKIALKFTDCVTAVSKDICDKLKKNYLYPNTLYIQNGVNSGKIRKSVAQCTMRIKKDNFVYCGRLIPVKRVCFLIEAFNECLKRGCRKDLYIIGDGEDESKIKDLIKVYGIEDRVTTLGALTHSQALGVINQCMCLLLSSLSEGCPLVVLEAMALGKTVIAPDVGGLKDIVIHGENGYLFPVDSQDIFCDLIMMIADNKKKASLMGLNGIKTISSKFDFDKVVKEYLNIYKSFDSRVD